MTTSILHSWAITGLFTHSLNTNCVNRITAELTSFQGDSEVKTEHEFWVAPNGEPVDFDTEPSTWDWFDKYEGFIPVANLTPEKIWEWIDERYDRKKLEAENEGPKSVTQPIELPW